MNGSGSVLDMHFRWSAVTVDCADPAVLASFWVAVLGGVVTVPLPGWRRLDTQGHTQPAITFQPVPEPKRGKTRIHFDLVVDDLEHSQEKVIGLGGCSLNQRHDYAEGIVVVMADPEGNEFCLVRYVD
jgi:predicted enzyme related to lactoylglutathione lyase